MRLYTQVLQRLGIGFTVVTSLDGYDEVSLTGTFKLTAGRYEKLCQPQDWQLLRVNPAEIYGGETPEEAARIFDNVLEDSATDSQRQCVVANAGVAIHTICPEKSFEACLAEAADSVASGRALQCFKRFLEVNS